MRGNRSLSVVARLASMVLALVVVLVTPLAAFAALEDGALYSSSTNPDVGDDATWRWGWGNIFSPDLVVTQVPADAPPGELSQTNGFIYDLHQVDQTGSGVTTPQWGSSSLSARPQGSTIKDSFDLAGVAAREGWVSRTGATVVAEGVYGLSLRYFNQFRVEDEATTDFLHFGLDLTKPSPVENLTSTAGALGATTQYTEARWRNLRWTMKGYDALSGVGGFKIMVNGEEAAFAHNVAPDPAYEPYASLLNPGAALLPPQVSNVTIEDLPAGESVLSVVVVDRATNESVASTVKAYVDFDTPEISITSPKSSARVGLAPTFTVTTTDTAGLARVKYYVDDVFVGASTTKPYSLRVNLGAFSNGAHTLKAIAEDRLANVGGLFKPHSATATVPFVLDKTVPAVSSVSGAPNPFFPRKRDGYKDNFRVKFRTSEAGTATMVIKNSKGKVVRTLTKKVNAGSQFVSWNGKQTDGTVRAGAFKYTLSMTDAAGNKRSISPRSVSIRFYEIVRVSGGAVRIVQR